MQSHNGLIDVRSEPGKGTSIALYFPIPTGPLPAPTERPLVSTNSVEGTETILIVDDESDVRYFLEFIFTSHGYQVLSAANEEAALAQLPAAPGQVHLLFSDVGLPTADGFELSKRLRARLPGVKTVLCSGYSDGSLKIRMAEEGIDGFVAKPYDTNELLQTIRAILDKK
jgi:two-component system cell cycle sensor histidine kinase/response regulator CckA